VGVPLFEFHLGGLGQHVIDRQIIPLPGPLGLATVGLGALVTVSASRRRR